MKRKHRVRLWLAKHGIGDTHKVIQSIITSLEKEGWVPLPAFEVKNSEDAIKKALSMIDEEVKALGHVYKRMDK